MNKHEELKSHINEFLNKLYSYQSRIFVLDETDGNLNVVYDSWAVEGKTIYNSSKGNYINGRASKGEGRIYLSDFKNFEGENYISTSVIKPTKKNKRQYLPSKEVILGGIYRGLDYTQFLYLGKNKKGQHTYLKKYSDFEFDDLANRGICYIDHTKNKKRFIEKIDQFEEYQVLSLYKKYKDKTGDVEKFDALIEACKEHDVISIKSMFYIDNNRVCRKCGKIFSKYE